MFKAAVLTVSDRSFRGERPDAGGPLVVEILKNAGYAVTETAIVPDEKGRIEAALRQWCDREPVELLVTTGGTGIFVHGRIQARPEVQGRADAAPLAGVLLRLQAGHRG